MDLGGCFGETSPSHSAQAVAALKVPKIFFILLRMRWIGWFQS